MHIFAGTLQQQDVAAPGGGSYPVVESVTVTLWNTNVTAHPAAMPATVASGNLLICFFANDADDTVTVPSGWTLMFTGLNADLDGRFGAYKKVAVGTEGGTTVGFTTSGTEQAAAQVYRISNWGGSLTHAVSGTAAAGFNPPSLTSGFGAVPTLWIACLGTADSGGISGNPASYTNPVSAISSESSFGAQVFTARRELTAATEDPGAFTSAIEFGLSNTVAVKGP